MDAERLGGRKLVDPMTDVSDLHAQLVAAIRSADIGGYGSTVDADEAADNIMAVLRDDPRLVLDALCASGALMSASTELGGTAWMVVAR